MRMIRALASSRFCATRPISEILRRTFVAPTVSTAPNNLPLNNYIRDHRNRIGNDGFVLHSPYDSIAIPDMTLDQYIWKNLDKWKNHVAIMCSVTGRKYTYSKLRDHCAALAIRLRNDLKLERNDIVGICMPNVPEFVIALLGSIEAGLVVTTINPNYTAEEISRQLVSSKPKVIYGIVDNFDVIKKACILAKLPETKVLALKTELGQTIRDDMINLMDLANTRGVNLSAASEFNANADSNQMVLLPYSSGTTGLPKGVMLSHNNITSNLEALDVKLPHERIMLPTTNDFQEIVPVVLPFYHCYALNFVLLSKLALGCKMIAIPKFEPNEYLRIIHEQKATFLTVVPPIVIQLAAYEHAKPYHFEYVRYMSSAASSLAHSDVERFREKAPNIHIFQAYGLTELSPISTIMPIHPVDLDNYGTIGWPVSNVDGKIVAVDDPNGIGLDAHQIGELWFRGPNVMLGYFQNVAATDETITKDGWLRTGDIGYYDDSGLFYITDRMKELIKVNAFQVAPAELEAIIRDHPDILDAVVVGVPHAKTGEVPRAFVVRKPDSKITAEQIQEFVAKQVIKYKQLTGGVYFVDNIPKTLTGKILRREAKKIVV